MGLSSIKMIVGIYGYWIPGGNRADVNLLDMPLDTPKTLQPDVTQPQPQKSKGRNHLKLRPFLMMVPKRGLEPLRGNPH